MSQISPVLTPLLTRKVGSSTPWYDSGIFQNGNMIQNFQTQEYRLNDVDQVFSDFWSLNRSSTKTAHSLDGSLTTFSANTPAITDRGILIEEDSTNTLLHSEDFSNAAWTKNNTTITADADLFLDGNTVGDRLTGDGTSNAHTITQNQTMNTSFINAISVYAKQGTERYCFVGVDAAGAGNPYAIFDLQTGTIATTSGCDAKILSEGDWYRLLVFDYTPTTAGPHPVEIGVTSSSSNRVSTASGYVSICGAQFELIHCPTSYIPTTTASVTREADNCRTSVTITDWMSNTAGSMAVKVETAFNVNNRRLLGFSSANSWDIDADNNNSDVYYGTLLNGVNTGSESFESPGGTTFGISWTSTGPFMRSVVKGSDVASGAHGVSVSGINFWLGSRLGTLAYVNGYIKLIAHRSDELNTDLALQNWVALA